MKNIIRKINLKRKVKKNRNDYTDLHDKLLMLLIDNDIKWEDKSSEVKGIRRRLNKLNDDFIDMIYDLNNIER